jgi:uncharacterized protein
LFQSIALLLFASEFLEESKNKIIAPKKLSLNRNVIKKLNDYTHQKFENSSINIFYSKNLKLPEKATFGEKISLAISKVLNEGFENIIVIGNDCPDLELKQVLAAASALKNKDWVIGPDLRGGTYLIGISKKVFDPLTFQNLNWQSSFLFEDLVSTYSSHSVLVLDPLQDINSFQDIIILKNKNHFAFLLFQTITREHSNIYQNKKVFSQISFIYNPYFRGPPAQILS